MHTPSFLELIFLWGRSCLLAVADFGWHAEQFRSSVLPSPDLNAPWLALDDQILTLNTYQLPTTALCEVKLRLGHK